MSSVVLTNCLNSARSHFQSSESRLQESSPPMQHAIRFFHVLCHDACERATSIATRMRNERLQAGRKRSSSACNETPLIVRLQCANFTLENLRAPDSGYRGPQENSEGECRRSPETRQSACHPTPCHVWSIALTFDRCPPSFHKKWRNLARVSLLIIPAWSRTPRLERTQGRTPPTIRRDADIHVVTIGT